MVGMAMEVRGAIYSSCPMRFRQVLPPAASLVVSLSELASECADSRLGDISQGEHQASHALEELLPQEWVISMLLPPAREHLACIRSDILE